MAKKELKEKTANDAIPAYDPFEGESAKRKGDDLRSHMVVSAPRMGHLETLIRGNAPLVIHAFGAKARQEIKDKQMRGSTARKGKLREPKDFQRMYEEAKHISTEGWCGIPASAFRNACISACRMVGFQMVRAKCSIFTEADGFDRVDGTPLVKITKEEPHYAEHPVRLETGVVDIHARPMWDPGWEARPRIMFDLDQFTEQDIVNLMVRVGIQIGLCEGRPFSKNSAGCGWGTFDVPEVVSSVKKAA